MSKIALTPNVSGSGVFTIASPATNTDRTLTLPDEAGTVLTDTGLPAELNATGSAPIYACRAWVNFNGTGTVAIRASGNVSSITDNNPGDYTVNFTTAMPDANFDALVTGDVNGVGDFAVGCTRDNLTVRTTSLVRVGIGTTGGLAADSSVVSVSIFR